MRVDAPNMDAIEFWSDPVEEVQLGAAAATLVLPGVTVAGIPANSVIYRVELMFKFRSVENTNVAGNALDGATVAETSQVIQVRVDATGTWTDAINCVDNQLTIAATTREGPDTLHGSINVNGEVVGDNDYEVRWLLSNADVDFLNFNDVQVGLKIWFYV